MKRFYMLLAVAIVAFASCQKDVVESNTPVKNGNIQQLSTNFRSYDEALKIAEDALLLLEGNQTRSTKKRVVKRTEGQTIMRSVTRSGEAEEEPIMYVFNNENNAGFTVVAANRSQQPLIAVTEKGNYTYGESTGVEPFDLYMENAIEAHSIIPPPTLPDKPLVPTIGFYYDTVYYHRASVDPILQTKWGQAGIYGKYCPNGLSGCAITATVQIIAYHQYPSIIRLTHKDPSVICNFNWASMLEYTESEFDSLTSCDCGCSYNQIATIMREVGERAGTTYYEDDPSTDYKEETTSGTGPYGVFDALVSLGYKDVEVIPYVDINLERELIYNDLDNNLPLFIGGLDQSGVGHAWVIDGYNILQYRLDLFVTNPDYNPNLIFNQEPEYIFHSSDIRDIDLLHFNWGWNGNCDGWFDYGVLAPGNADCYDDVTESNQSDYNWCNQLFLIYNITD